MKVLTCAATLGVVLSLSACGAPKEMEHDHSAHMHPEEGIEVTGVVPTVDLIMHKDPKSGWNAQIVTTNFRFSPENASLDHIEGEGHAHIYINGEKINRVYGEWYHLANAVAGDTVMVNLNANDHAPLLSSGAPIADEEVLTDIPE